MTCLRQSHRAINVLIARNDSRALYAKPAFCAYITACDRREEATERRVYVRGTQRGCWPAHFWMTLLRMRYLLSTPRDRPPFPRNWLHASFHAIYSRARSVAFHRREARYWLCLSTESTWLSSSTATRSSLASEIQDVQHLSFADASVAPGISFTSLINDTRKDIQFFKNTINFVI